MDALDLLLSSIDSKPKASAPADDADDSPDIISMALSEFKTAKKPADQLEAFKLLLQLAKK